MVDGGCALNPYFLSIDIEPTDPPLINFNNLPVRCSQIASVVCEDTDLDGIAEPTDPGFDGILVELFDCNDLTIPLATQVTSNGGQYDFSNLPAGCYRLRFDLPTGFAVLGGGGIVGADGWTSDIAIDFGDCYTQASFCLTMANSALGNFVWHDLDGDGVQDNGEPGIENVRVTLFNSNGFVVGFQFTDSNGFYLFDELTPGEYYVSFETPNGFTLTDSNRGNNDNSDSDVDSSNGPGTTATTFLDPAETDLSWDAGYYLCTPVGDYVWLDANSNNRQDNSENGINGVRVNLFRIINGQGFLFDFDYTDHQPGTPSDDGYFKFCAPPGEYYLEFEVSPSLSPVNANSGGTEGDSNVTGSFGPNTTGAFTVTSGDAHRCDIDGGYRLTGATNGNTTESSALGDIQIDDISRIAAVNLGSSNKVDWKANVEVDIEYYTIERYDEDFIEIGKVLSKGTIDGASDYDFNDLDFKNGFNRYRVRAFNGSGVIVFEDLTEVYVRPAVESDVKLYPNITTSNTTLDVSVSERVSLKVSMFSADGLSMLRDIIDEEIMPGRSSYLLETDELPSGVYYLRVLIDGTLTTKKLIVLDN